MPVVLAKQGVATAMWPEAVFGQIALWVAFRWRLCENPVPRREVTA
jgi:hypothetical protein